MIRICPRCMRDWSTVGTMRKLLCLLAVILVLAAMLSPFLTGQSRTDGQSTLSESADQVRIADLERRADKADSLPERMASLEEKVTQTKTQVDSLNNRAWYVLVAALAALLDRVLGAFGIRIRDRSS